MATEQSPPRNWYYFQKYAYNESIQRAHFTIRSNKANNNLCIFVTASFQRWSGKPSLFSSEYDEYAIVCEMIKIKTNH